MKFTKGDFFKVKFDKTEGAGHRSVTRTITGKYEVIRTGKKLYLFCNATGHDWHPTKQELEEAIKNNGIDIEQVIEDLTGSCDSLHSVLNSYGFTDDDMTSEKYLRLDEEIFCCDSCGWWCEINEEHENDNGDRVCDDCHEDE